MGDVGQTDRVVTLNADVGESYGAWELGDDAALLDVVTHANVACGFHAGDPRTMRRTCELAVERGVVIGAQVSYDDLAGFGRRFMEVPHDHLVDDVIAQLGALSAFANIAGGAVSYVKPHGALYNAIVHHQQQAAAVVEAIRQFDPGLPLVGLPSAHSLALAREAGLATVHEGFADRGYRADGTLVPRTEDGAVLNDADEIAARCVRMARGAVTAVDGSELDVDVQSICVHGDTPGAVEIARAVRHALEAEDLLTP